MNYEDLQHFETEETLEQFEEGCDIGGKPIVCGVTGTEPAFIAGKVFPFFILRKLLIIFI